MVNQFSWKQIQSLMSNLQVLLYGIHTQINQYRPDIVVCKLMLLVADGGLSQTNLIHSDPHCFKFLPDHKDATVADHILNMNGIGNQFPGPYIGLPHKGSLTLQILQ